MKNPNWLGAAVALAAIVANVLWTRFHGGVIPWQLALGAVLAVVAAVLIQHPLKARAALQRVRRERDAGVARVYVNEVEVGALPELQYRQVVAEAWAKGALYARQALNLLDVGKRIAFTVMRLIPWTWFALVAIAALVMPTELATGFAAMAKGTPAQWVEAVRSALAGGAMLGVVAVAFGVATGGLRFGFVNEFDRDIAQRLRQLLEEPADGRLSVRVVGARLDQGRLEHGQ